MANPFNPRQIVPQAARYPALEKIAEVPGVPQLPNGLPKPNGPANPPLYPEYRFPTGFDPNEAISRVTPFRDKLPSQHLEPIGLAPKLYPTHAPPKAWQNEKVPRCTTTPARALADQYTSIPGGIASVGARAQAYAAKYPERMVGIKKQDVSPASLLRPIDVWQVPNDDSTQGTGGFITRDHKEIAAVVPHNDYGQWDDIMHTLRHEARHSVQAPGSAATRYLSNDPRIEHDWRNEEKAPTWGARLKGIYARGTGNEVTDPQSAEAAHTWILTSPRSRMRGEAYEAYLEREYLRDDLLHYQRTDPKGWQQQLQDSYQWMPGTVQNQQTGAPKYASLQELCKAADDIPGPTPTYGPVHPPVTPPKEPISFQAAMGEAEDKQKLSEIKPLNEKWPQSHLRPIKDCPGWQDSGVVPEKWENKSVPVSNLSPARILADQYTGIKGGIGAVASRAEDYAAKYPGRMKPIPQNDFSPSNLLRPVSVWQLPRGGNSPKGWMRPWSRNIAVTVPDEDYNNWPSMMPTIQHEARHALQRLDTYKPDEYPSNDPRLAHDFNSAEQAPSYGAELKGIYAKATGKEVTDPRSAEEAYKWLMRNPAVPGEHLLRTLDPIWGRKLEGMETDEDRLRNRVRYYERNAPETWKKKQQEMYQWMPGTVQNQQPGAPKYASLQTYPALEKLAEVSGVPQPPVTPPKVPMSFGADEYQRFKNIKPLDGKWMQQNLAQPHLALPKNMFPTPALARPKGLFQTPALALPKSLLPAAAASAGRDTFSSSEAAALAKEYAVEPPRDVSPRNLPVPAPVHGPVQSPVTPPKVPMSLADAEDYQKLRNIKPLNENVPQTHLEPVKDLPGWQHSDVVPKDYENRSVPVANISPAQALAGQYAGIKGGISDVASRAEDYASKYPERMQPIYPSDFSPSNLLRPAPVWQVPCGNNKTGVGGWIHRPTRNTVMVVKPYEKYNDFSRMEPRIRHEARHMLQKSREFGDLYPSPDRALAHDWSSHEQAPSYGAELKGIYAKETGKEVTDPRSAEEAYKWLMSRPGISDEEWRKAHDPIWEGEPEGTLPDDKILRSRFEYYEQADPEAWKKKQQEMYQWMPGTVRNQQPGAPKYARLQDLAQIVYTEAD